MQQEFIKLGGTLLDCHQVTEIIPGDSVTVVTNRGSFKTRNVVIAAGPWAPTLCSSIGLHLPLKVTTEYFTLQVVLEIEWYIPANVQTVAVYC